MNRRAFIAASSVAALAAALPLRAEDAPPEDRLFIIVFADGGWDPTRVMLPAFGVADVEPEAVVSVTGGLTFIDHPDRPKVRSFLETYSARTAFINGIAVPSVSHGVCRGMLMTGTRAAEGTDWTTRIARARSAQLPLPHLVLSGPVFAGDSPGAVARVGGRRQLAELLTGAALDDLDPRPMRLSDAGESLVEARLLREQATPGGPISTRLADAAADALARLGALRATPNLDALLALDAEADPWRWAAEALAAGVSRCVTLSWPSVGVLPWDSHGGNDTLQSAAFEDLFDQLTALMARLASTVDAAGTPLDRRVTVVVLSEMGRSPLLNSVAGKDHWPYTSAILIGSGVAGGQALGGVDRSFRGLGINRETGATQPDAEPPTTETLGATLLAIAGVDVAEELPGVEPLWSLLS